MLYLAERKGEGYGRRLHHRSKVDQRERECRQHLQQGDVWETSSHHTTHHPGRGAVVAVIFFAAASTGFHQWFTFVAFFIRLKKAHNFDRISELENKNQLSKCMNKITNACVSLRRTRGHLERGRLYLQLYN